MSGNGTENVAFSGTASSTIVESSGTAVADGGTIISTTVASGGNEYVYSSGTASFTTVNSGGAEGRVLRRLDQLHHGEQRWHRGRVRRRHDQRLTTVNSAGAEMVSAGGSATSTTLSTGGYLVAHARRRTVERGAVGRCDRLDRRGGLISPMQGSPATDRSPAASWSVTERRNTSCPERTASVNTVNSGNEIVYSGGGTAISNNRQHRWQ